jgi:hypothetical protein
MSPGDLDLDDLLRFLALLTTIFRGYEDMFVQYQHGTIDDQAWEASRRGMASYLDVPMPGVARFWAIRGGVFRREFQDLVRQLAQHGLPAPGSEDPTVVLREEPTEAS